jgi:hypothetical protein
MKFRWMQCQCLHVQVTLDVMRTWADSDVVAPFQTSKEAGWVLMSLLVRLIPNADRVELGMEASHCVEMSNISGFMMVQYVVMFHV